MWLHSPRQVGTCVAGKTFYTCAKGAFKGCCSTDPCDAGLCGDDSNSDSNPTNLETSNSASTTDNSSLTASTVLESSSVITSTSSLTSTDSTESVSTSTASPSSTTRQSGTPTVAEAILSSTPQPNDTSQPPVGAIVGGVLGGLSLLAVLSFLLWDLAQRRSKLSIKVDRSKEKGKKEKDKKDKKRESELAEAEAAVLEREKFLDAAKQNTESEVRNGDPFAEFGGCTRDSYVAGRPGHRYYQQQNPSPSSNSAYSHTRKPLPAITHTPPPASNLSKVQQHVVSLSSIRENESFENNMAVNDAEFAPVEMLVATNLASLNQQGSGHNGMTALPTTPHVDPPASPKGRQVDDPARTSFAKSTDFSVSSNTNSYASSGSPVSREQSKEIVAPDGVVMRSNLDVTRTQKAQPGSVRKYVMSFMEYETENKITCSSERGSLIMPGKAHLSDE